jgi:hypothetical protein
MPLELAPLASWWASVVMFAIAGIDGGAREALSSHLVVKHVV